MINYFDGNVLYTKEEIDPYVEELANTIASLQETIQQLEAKVQTLSWDVGGLLTIRGTGRYITSDKVDSTFTQAGLWQYVSGTWTLVEEVSEGHVYNIDSAFTTDSAFVEGAGLEVVAGTNIVAVNEGTDTEPDIKWDVFALSMAAVDITSETAAREAADSALQSSIDGLQASLDALQSSLADEASARATADTALQANIDAEASARQSADSSLQSQIDELQADQINYWYGSKSEFDAAKDTLSDNTFIFSPDDL